MIYTDLPGCWSLPHAGYLFETPSNDKIDNIVEEKNNQNNNIEKGFDNDNKKKDHNSDNDIITMGISYRANIGWVPHNDVRIASLQTVSLS